MAPQKLIPSRLDLTAQGKSLLRMISAHLTKLDLLEHVQGQKEPQTPPRSSWMHLIGVLIGQPPAKEKPNLRLVCHSFASLTSRKTHNESKRPCLSVSLVTAHNYKDDLLMRFEAIISIED